MAKRGRKPTNATGEEVREKLAAYLAECEAKNRPVSITRMGLALGYNSRQAFAYAMANQKDEGVREALRDAHSHYVAAIEEKAMEGKGGGLMLLLNSQGYVAKSESKTESKVLLEKGDKQVLLAQLRANRERALEDKTGDIIEGQFERLKEVEDATVEDWV